MRIKQNFSSPIFFNDFFREHVTHHFSIKFHFPIWTRLLFFFLTGTIATPSKHLPPSSGKNRVGLVSVPSTRPLYQTPMSFYHLEYESSSLTRRPLKYTFIIWFLCMKNFDSVPVRTYMIGTYLC
jgi:hypothetical protein